MYSNSYYACLILVRDMNRNVFGALLDTMPQESSANEYIGGHDSFLFTIKPEMQGYLSTAENDYIMLSQPD